MKRCIVCESKDYEKLFKVGDFEYFKCRKCDLVKRNGKSEISYDSYHRDEDYQKYVECFKNIYKKRFNIIKRFRSKPGRVLDIGASAGAMLEIFRRNGWVTWGVEPSLSAKISRNKDIRILRTKIEKAKLPKNYFDVAILNHTLEHLKNPVSVLKKVKTVLKKDGIVYVDVPNFASLDSRIWQARWKYLIPEEHLYQFTPKTLSAAFEKAGLKLIWWRTWSGIFDVANPFLHLFQELIDLRVNFINDVLYIPTNIITTTLNVGTSLAMVGEKR